MIYVRPDARRYFPTETTVDDFLRIPSAVCREFKNRRTGRFVRMGRAFFIKVHEAAGWWPVLEDLVRFRNPQVGAQSEWLAVQAVAGLGISTLRIVAYGEEGTWPARQRSFLITEAIAPAISLESFVERKEETVCDGSLKRRLIRELAAIARRLHSGGVNHRDFYLCHFLLSPPPSAGARNQRPVLHLIDLHRAQQRDRAPQRWVVKDLAGLLFSAMDANLTSRDLALFVRSYSGTSLRRALRENGDFWRLVERRARQLYLKCHRRPPACDLPTFPPPKTLRRIDASQKIIAPKALVVQDLRPLHNGDRTLTNG